MSKHTLLEIKDLHVNVEDKEILDGVDLSIGSDETHVLMGPNGTGKSTLGYAITGHPVIQLPPAVFFLMEKILQNCQWMNVQRREFSYPSRIRSRCPE